MKTTLRRLGHAVLLASTLFAAAASAGEALLDEARALVKQQRYAAALSRVERYLGEAPKDAGARFLKGVLLVETGRDDEAIAEFKALVRDHPELPEPYNNLAVLYAARGQYGEARDALLSAINTHPSYAIAHENLGDIYAKLAGIAYDKALSLDDSNAAARAKLALVRELFSAGAVTTGAETAPEVVAAAPEAVATPPAASMPEPAPVQQPEPVPESTPAPASAPAPAAAAAPAPAPASPAIVSPSPAVEEQAVTETVLGWAKAWSARDVSAYLGHYGRGFQPPGGMARAKWEAERRKRLRAPSFIKVTVSDLHVEVQGVDRARAVFTQRYRSDTYADRVRKVLGLAREDGAWRIVSEVSTK